MGHECSWTLANSLLQHAGLQLAIILLQQDVVKVIKQQE